MNEQARIYAQLLLQEKKNRSESEFDSFFNLFIQYLQEKKREKLLPAIYREINQLLEQKESSNETTLVVASDADIDQIKNDIKSYESEFDLENMSIETDKHIVGGYTLKNARTMIDASYRTALLDLYKKIVNQTKGDLV
tara:strand:- start:22 stop:438 length:417 start_codon:yes stop_codon:yes gene_type:complete